MSVTHGAVDAARFPVLLGHYEGSLITGLEAEVDRRLGGRLLGRQLAGLYPDQPDDAIVVSGPAGGRPAGAVVVGLGGRGELTATVLAGAVERGVMAHALAVADRGEGGAVSISAALVGAQRGDGLAVETATLAVVEGVAAAVHQLTTHPLGTSLGLEHVELELVEPYAGPAERAARVVRDLADLLGSDVLDQVAVAGAPRLAEAGGARPGDIPATAGDSEWRRLVVTAIPDEQAPGGALQLQFTAMGLRSRAELLTQGVDPRLVAELLATVQRGGATVRAQDVHRALYELLVPADLKHDLASVPHLAIVVDEHTADLPWELLASGSAHGTCDALALRTGLLRQLRLPSPRRPLAPSASTTALVIGNPPGGSGHPDLPAAAREARAVADALASAGYAVERLVYDAGRPAEGSSGDIAVALLSGEHRLLHVAGHGHYEQGPDGPWGGIVIGPGSYLTAATIGQMTRPPDLVFLNCCHLGRIDPGAVEAPGLAGARRHANQLAASLARQLMGMGVGAVVVAGWPVVDDTAEIFSTELYRQLLDGEPLGDAVRHARRRAHDHDAGSSSTWAAYQCYGAPSFRLATPRPRPPRPQPPVSCGELERLVVDLSVRAGDVDADTGALAAALDELLADLPPEWRQARVLAAFGVAYGEMGLWEPAVSLLRAAAETDLADLPVRSVEQLCNYEVRLAEELHRAGDAARPAQLLEEAGTRLDALLALGPSAERHALAGSLHKRWAVVGYTKHVADAVAHYARAGLTYTALNAIQLCAATGLPEPVELRGFLDGLAVVERPSGYWEAVERCDAALARSLTGGSVAAEVDELVAGYARAFEWRSTTRQRRSTVDHVLDLAELAASAEPPNPELAGALRQVGQALAVAAAPGARPRPSGP